MPRKRARGEKLIARMACGIALSFCISGSALAQAPVKLTIDASKREFRIPDDFVGLGFETRSVVPDEYGVSGYFFSPSNTQLITLFRNIDIRQIRVGGER